MLNVRYDKFLDNYTIIKKIGEGVSGSLYLCHDHESRRYVLKKLPKNDDSRRELYIQYYLKSKYIINIIEIFEAKLYYYVVLEYADGGDLFDRLNTMRLKDKEICAILLKIAWLIKYIHDKGIVHADIKMENILIKNDTLRLADFGFSNFVGGITTTSDYTIPYTSPEQLNNANRCFKSDVWSLGMIAYFLYFGVHPFNIDDADLSSSREISDATKMFKSQLTFHNAPISYKFKNLIKKMLVFDCEKRCSLQYVIRVLEKMV
jgi:serine/threonine protein kinase